MMKHLKLITLIMSLFSILLFQNIIHANAAYYKFCADANNGPNTRVTAKQGSWISSEIIKPGQCSMSYSPGPVDPIAIEVLYYTGQGTTKGNDLVQDAEHNEWYWDTTGLVTVDVKNLKRSGNFVLFGVEAKDQHGYDNYLSFGGLINH